jgi:CBS domain-containing protein
MLSDVTPVAPSDEVFRVQERLAESKLHVLPVAEGGRFLGLITRRDIEELYRVLASRPGLIARAEAG